MTAIDLGMPDLFELVSRDVVLRKVASTKGGEYAGPCPLCGGTDRFRVWPDHPSGTARWKCMGSEEGRGGCGKGGDAIAYLVERGDLTPAEAGRMRRGESHLQAPQAARSRRLPVQPPVAQHMPDPGWQRAGRAFVSQAQESLWATENALVWLRSRGLSKETIRAAGLGWNPQDAWQHPREWGLPDGDRIRLPRGWVIPWEVEGDLWQVSIRCPEGTPKYWMVKGSKHALYNAGALAPGKPAILTEGVFDALSISQVAGDVITAVAAGSTTGARGLRWIAKLALCSVVLVSFDAEADKGDKAAAWWVGILDNARRWRPYWADANAMAQEGVDLRQWILAGLGPAARPVPEISDGNGRVDTRSSMVFEMGSTGTWQGHKQALQETQMDAALPSIPTTPLPVPESPSPNLKPTWTGRRVKLEDLSEFKNMWGLRTVRSEWPVGETRPTVYLAPAHLAKSEYTNKEEGT